MNRKQLKEISHGECHDCSPKAWHDIQKITGDYDLDATIAHRDNADLPLRLMMYRPKTAYSAYGGYHGDD